MWSVDVVQRKGGDREGVVLGDSGYGVEPEPTPGEAGRESTPRSEGGGYLPSFLGIPLNRSMAFPVFF